MSKFVPILKDEISQCPVPTAWRGTFSEIVKRLKTGDFELKQGVAGVRPVSSKDATRMEKNVQDYGARLIDLPDESWETSVCQWMCGYWDVLIDLFTAEEGASDLVLVVRVYEDGLTYVFELRSVHVP